MKKSQKQWVLSQLKSGRTLTSNDAWTEYGITRLAAIIHNLIHTDSHNISMTMEDHTSRAGEHGQHGRYKLIRPRVQEYMFNPPTKSAGVLF